MLSQKQKKDKLRALADEVSDFHPFLLAVLEKLPGVKNVRYTHGNREFGADVVFEKYDETADRLRHVGVVAKVGQITQGDLPEIKRQIEECRLMPRLTEQGKKEVVIDEVWVMNNDTISQNAKELIAKAFKSYAVLFFDGQDLSDRVSKHASFLWTQVPTGIGQYLVALDSRLETADVDAQLLGPVKNIPSIDIEVEVAEISNYDGSTKKKKVGKKRAQIVKLDEEIQKNRVVVVEGEMGAGKSQLLRRIGRTLSSLDRFDELKQVPVHVSYRRLVSDFEGSIEKCIAAELGPVCQELDGCGATTLILVDGVDEVLPTASKVADPIEALASQVRDRTSTRLIVATRPKPRGKVVAKVASDIRVLQIRPLSIGKIVNFVREVCKAAKLPERLIDDVNRSELFRQLPQNPIAAQLLTRLLLDRKDELPQSLTELYNKAIELMLGRWDVLRGLAEQQEYEVAKRIFCKLADLVMRHELTVLSVADVRQAVSDYLAERNLVVNSEKVLTRMFDRSGILAVDEESGAVHFRHRSFAEYLFALNQVDKADLGNECEPFEPYWLHSYFFWFGIKGDCEDDLRSVMAAPVESSDASLLRVFFGAQYLMAGHLSPYSVAREWVYKLLLEVARWYLDVVAKKIESPLSRLTPMQLLWLLTVMIKGHYGYRFFHKAIEDAAVNICQSIEAPDVKATALFFTSVIANELGDEAPFALLLDEFKPSDLPFPIALAINGESSSFDKKRLTAALRAYNKRFKRMLDGNPALQKSAHVLFDDPIRTMPMQGKKRKP